MRLDHRSGRLAALVLAALLLAGCVGRPAAAPPAPSVQQGLNGAALSPVVQLPGLTMQRADGRPFSAAETRGRLSLFFFGYTFCPDVCPLTLIEVTQVRRELGAQAGQVDSYFVTVDPDRDTPARLAEYVAHFDSAITGLTGTPEELARVREVFGVVAQKRVIPESTAGYFMDHSAGLYLVDGDSRIRLVYPYGTAPGEIAADLKLLLEQGAATPSEPAPAVPPAAQPPASAPTAATAGLRVEGAWARPSVRAPGELGGTSAVYLTVRNDAPVDDRLLAAESPAARSTELHRTTVDQGVMRMEPSGPLPVPAGGQLTLRSGSAHIMLIDLQQYLAEGGEIALTLRFERAGELRLTVPVRSSADPTGRAGG